MDLWYIKILEFPSLNDGTSSYTPGSSVSYPAHKLLAILFHITMLKISLRSAVIHAHTYTGKFYLTHSRVLGLWQWQLQLANECLRQNTSLVTMVWMYLWHNISFRAEPVVGF
jgi:hypothetical protein